METIHPNIIGAIIAAIVGLIAAIIASHTAKFVANLSKRTKVAEFRQAWINALRDDIANYMGAAELWHDKFLKISKENLDDSKLEIIFNELDVLSNQALVFYWKIKLRINPRPNRFKEEDDQFLSSLHDLLKISILDRKTPIKSWRLLADKAAEQSRELLKREWEIAKKMQD